MRQVRLMYLGIFAAAMLQAGSAQAQTCTRSLATTAARDTASLRSILAEDRSLRVGRCGVLEVRDPGPSWTSIAASPASAIRTKSLSADQTFSLHSNPGASRVIYLNFIGQASHSDPQWNGNQPFETPTFSLDGDRDSWSDAELAFVQQVWQSMAEDYAPFQIDVTTQDPGSSAIVRSDSSDQNYGTQVHITNHTSWSPSCGCGGVAGVGLFDAIGFTSEKAWVFTDGTGSNSVFTALAAAHEAGHTLGLLHQGTKIGSTVENYAMGWNPWGPIMGAPYYMPVTHWSNSDYKSAYVSGTGKQDDIVVMQRHGAVLKTDDYGNNLATAFKLYNNGNAADGLISARTDSDWFAVQTGTNTISVLATPADWMPDLDVSLTLYSSAGKQLAVSSPLTSSPGGGQSGLGMSAAVQAKVTPGTYYVKVDGAGQGAMSNYGSYSDYGSLGAYHIQTTDPISITDTTLDSGTANSSYSYDLHSTGGSGSISWSVASGSLPAGLSLVNSSGQWRLSGTPLYGGSYTFALQATDANGMQSAPVAFALSLTPSQGPTLPILTLKDATRTVNYSTTITATPNSNTPLTWTVVGLPAGMSYQVSSGAGTVLTIKGAASQSGLYHLAVRANNGIESARGYVIIVNALPDPIITNTPSRPVLSKRYSFQLKASQAKGPLQWSIVAGSLPDGLTLSTSGAITGTTSDSSSHSFTIRVVDANGERTQKEFSLTAA